MTQSLITTEGVRIQISDRDSDDFIREVVSVRATHPAGVAVLWKLPQRLMRRFDAVSIVAEEIQAELEERVQAAEARKGSPFRLVRVDS